MSLDVSDTECEVKLLTPVYVLFTTIHKCSVHLSFMIIVHSDTECEVKLLTPVYVLLRLWCGVIIIHFLYWCGCMTDVIGVYYFYITVILLL